MRWIQAAVLASLALAAAALWASQGRYWEGRPELDKGEARGYFLWNDPDGWHVRWVTRGERHVFSGQVTCDGRFLEVRAVAKERGDFIKKTSDSSIEFDARAAGDLDGFDFRLSPSTGWVAFDFKIDGRRAQIQEVKMGRGKRHPDGLPFRIYRKAPGG